MQQLTINAVADDEEILLGKGNMENINKIKNINEFRVSYYDPMCEDHAQIERVIPIKYSCFKLFILVLLSIMTGSLIIFCIIWFPKLKFYLMYSIVPIDQAKKVAIYGTDGELYFIPIQKPSLPDLEKKSSFIYTNYSVNIPKGAQYIIMFTFKLFKYIFDPLEMNFIPLKIQLDTTHEKIILECSQGLNEDEYIHQRLIYGICDLDIKVKSFVRLLAEEFTDPFYLFQVFSVILWMTNEYELYASIIIITTLASLFVGAWETRKNLLNIQVMARYSCPVNILRKDSKTNRATFIQRNSTELVPGDIFELQEEGLAMPCDCLLIQGTVIINEAMLTGESTPIIKSQLPQIKDHFTYDADKKYFLFAGTRIIQKRSREKKKLLGLVTETGFNTIKGNLIRSILYPKKMDEQFEKDSYKYIAMMSILCIFGFIISIPFLMKTQEWVEILKKSLDLITTAVPPSLPACLGIGISYSIARLKKQKIMCIDRDKVNTAGKINILCFDKTGTLTEDHLDIYGYRSVKMKSNSQEFQFNPFIKDAYNNSSQAYNYYKSKRKKGKQNKDKNQDLNLFFVECLASCHCATYVNGKIIGDPVDVKMFESSGWTLHENSAEQEEKTSHNMISTFVRPGQEEDLQTKIQRIKEKQLGPNEIDEIDRVMEDHYELGIIRRFDFVPKLQRMSVITKNVNENFYKVFCKGSPEKLKELCLPETIPDNFNDTLNKYAIQGFRILAMAFKTIKMSYMQSQQLTRDKAESKMIFLGLLIVQNKLKTETKPSLNLLENAGLKSVMATGDNILTAIAVSKECELIKKNSLVYSCEIEDNKLVWNAIENFDEENDPGEFIIETKKEGDSTDNMVFEKSAPEQPRKKSDLLFEEGNNEMNVGSNLKSEFDINLNENKMRSSDMNIFKNEDGYKDNIFTDIIKKAGKDEGYRKSVINQSNKVRVALASGLEYDGKSFIDNFPPDRYSILYSKRPSVLVNVPILPSSEKEKAEINPKAIPDDASALMGLEIKEYPFENIQEDYVIAMTGKTFEILSILRERFLATDNENLRIYNDIFKIILLHGRVFARMAPEHKALLVEGYKKEKLGVLMCGDGANDCMALRTANVGVSLSEEEASVAAPFTSKNQNISCIIPLLKEGKCSLVTTLQTFKYMMLYSLVQFICVTLCMVLGSYLSENQFLSVDIFIIIPLAFFIPATGPYKELTKHHPTDSLISYPVISSILSQTIISFIFQILAHFLVVWQFDESKFIIEGKQVTVFGHDITLEKYYDNVCRPDDEGCDIIACPDNTSVFLIANIQYLITAFAFCISKPFKSPIYTNPYLTFFMVFAFVYSCVIILWQHKFLSNLLQMYNFETPEDSFVDEVRKEEIADIDNYYVFKNDSIKYYIQALALTNFVLSYLCEKLFVPYTTFIWNARKIQKLKELKQRESEQALTMQQLFAISE